MCHLCRDRARARRRARARGAVYGQSSPHPGMPQTVWNEVCAQVEGLADGEPGRLMHSAVLLGSDREDASPERKVAA